MSHQRITQKAVEGRQDWVIIQYIQRVGKMYNTIQREKQMNAEYY